MGYIVSKNDIKLNFDRWNINDHKILYITGLSGSGKSTLGKLLAMKHFAKYIELDMFSLFLVKGEKYWWKRVEEKRYNPHELIIEYVQSRKFYKYNTWANLLNDYGYNEHYKFLVWLKQKAELDNRLYIVEGAQLFMNLKKGSTSFFADSPFIITGTSMMKSWIRRCKRSVDDSEDENNISTWMTVIKKELPMLKYYFENEKLLEDFIKEIYKVNDEASRKTVQ